MHFPECITELKGPMTGFSGSGWLVKRNAMSINVMYFEIHAVHYAK